MIKEEQSAGKMLASKTQSHRRQIRAEEHKQMMAQRRKVIINERFPLKSRTFQGLVNTPADELPNLTSEINTILKNALLSSLNHQDLADLVDDLSYLLRQTPFEIQFQLILPKTQDPSIGSFVAEFFMILEPKEVQAWLGCMDLDDRKFLYCCLTQQDEEYLTNGLVKMMIADLAEIEVIEFIQELFSMGKGKNIIKIQLVAKIIHLIEQEPKRSFLYYKVANFLALTNLKEGFSKHLIKIIYANVNLASDRQLVTFASLACDLLTADPQIVCLPVIIGFVGYLEMRILGEESQKTYFFQERSIVKFFVLMVESSRKIRLNYEPDPRIMQALKKVGFAEDTEYYAKKLLRLMNLQ